MKRREFITLLGGAAIASPLAARAQQGAMRRIGVMLQIGESDPEAQSRLSALTKALQDLGWVQGRDYRIEYRSATESLSAVATELIGLKPDVILSTTSQNVQELKRQTSTIPLMFVNATDVVETGVVSSLSHPGGNITGFTGNNSSIGGKWLELLKEIAPGTKRVLAMINPGSTANEAYRKVLDASAGSFGMRISAIDMRNAADIESAIALLAREPGGAIVALPGGPITANRKTIIAAAMKHRVPAIYAFGYYAAEGGLMSYGADVRDLWRRAATYVDRIFKGEKPADLPVQAPVKFELAINLKTAKAIGLDVPWFLQQRADEVIE